MMAHSPTEINWRLAVEIMEWHKEHRSGLWTVTECNEGKCDIWVDKDGNQQCKAEEDSYVFGYTWNPYYNLTHAFMVLEKMTLPEDKGGLDYYCRMEVLPLADKEARYKCTFTKSDGMLGEGPSNSWKAYAATLSAAISLAVLEAKGEKK